MQEDVRNMSQAWELWDRVWADVRIAYLPEPEHLEPELRVQSRFSSKSRKIWADAYLLSFAIVTGVRLVTFDRAMQSRKADVLVL